MSLAKLFSKSRIPSKKKKKREKVNRVCIKARVQHLLKFRATVSCLYPTAEGMATIYIPTLSQRYVWITLNSPPLAN